MDPDRSDRRPGLQPPRFGLSTLMIGVSVLAVLLALIHYAGSHYTLVIFLFALAVAAHVVGNALGTRLRENGDTPLRDKSGRISRVRMQKTAAADFAPATKLRHRSSLGRPVFLITSIGAVASALVGSIVLFWIGGGQAELVAIACGGIAAGTLGGLAAFLSASFLQVAIAAFWQASRETRKP